MSGQDITARESRHGPRPLRLESVNGYQRTLRQQSCAQGASVLAAADRFVLGWQRLGARRHPEFDQQCNRDRGQRHVDANPTFGAPERCAHERDIRVGDGHVSAGEFGYMPDRATQTYDPGRLLLCHTVSVLDSERARTLTLSVDEFRTVRGKSAPHRGWMQFDVTIDRPISIDVWRTIIRLGNEAEVSP